MKRYSVYEPIQGPIQAHLIDPPTKREHRKHSSSSSSSRRDRKRKAKKDKKEKKPQSNNPNFVNLEKPVEKVRSRSKSKSPKEDPNIIKKGRGHMNSSLFGWKNEDFASANSYLKKVDFNIKRKNKKALNIKTTEPTQPQSDLNVDLEKKGDDNNQPNRSFNNNNYQNRRFDRRDHRDYDRNDRYNGKYKSRDYDRDRSNKGREREKDQKIDDSNSKNNRQGNKWSHDKFDKVIKEQQSPGDKVYIVVNDQQAKPRGSPIYR